MLPRVLLGSDVSAALDDSGKTDGYLGAEGGAGEDGDGLQRSSFGGAKIKPKASSAKN